MPIEFLHGRPLEADELDVIRVQIESGFEVGDLKVIATQKAAERWCAEHDSEGVRFDYPIASQGRLRQKRTNLRQSKHRGF